MKEQALPSILFVCMGNICRSPLAEGMARMSLANAGIKARLDSAGTHDYHPGSPPDSRARAVAREFGFTIDDLRARQVVAEDFQRFDWMLAADVDNLALLRQRQPRGSHARVSLLLPWCGLAGEEDLVDPYYGDMDGFRVTARLLQEAMTGLLHRLPSQA